MVITMDTMTVITATITAGIMAVITDITAIRHIILTVITHITLTIILIILTIHTEIQTQLTVTAQQHLHHQTDIAEQVQDILQPQVQVIQADTEAQLHTQEIRV